MAKCNRCGHEQYYIKRLYTGYGEDLYLIECGECLKFHPVVVSYSLDTDEILQACDEAWKAANRLPSDADPCLPVDPSPMHQPVPIPVPELDWQQKEQAEHDLLESNRKSREEIKRILGQ